MRFGPFLRSRRGVTEPNGTKRRTSLQARWRSAKTWFSLICLADGSETSLETRSPSRMHPDQASVYMNVFRSLCSSFRNSSSATEVCSTEINLHFGLFLRSRRNKTEQNGERVSRLVGDLRKPGFPYFSRRRFWNEPGDSFSVTEHPDQASVYMNVFRVALLVIPELELPDRGLFDGNQVAFRSLFEIATEQTEQNGERVSRLVGDLRKPGFPYFHWPTVPKRAWRLVLRHGSFRIRLPFTTFQSLNKKVEFRIISTRSLVVGSADVP